VGAGLWFGPHDKLGFLHKLRNHAFLSLSYDATEFAKDVLGLLGIVQLSTK
jgi:hypothetical protein